MAVNTEADGDETDASNTDRSLQHQHFHGQSTVSMLGGGTKHKRRNLDAGQVRSITNEKYAHILYYPVVTGAFGKAKAVVEVCFNDLRKVPKNVITNQIQTFLETFGGQLNSLESRLRTFCKFTDSAIVRRDGI